MFRVLHIVPPSLRAAGQTQLKPIPGVGMVRVFNRVPGPGQSDAECQHFPYPLHGSSTAQQLSGNGGTGAAECSALPPAKHHRVQPP